MSNNPYIYVDCGGGDHKTANYAMRGCMATGQSPWAQAWLEPSLRSRQYAGSVCDDSVAEAEYAAIVALYKWTLPLPFNRVNST